MKVKSQARILEVSGKFEAIIGKLNEKITNVENSAARSATVATTLKDEFLHAQIKLGQISDVYNASRDKLDQDDPFSMANMISRRLNGTSSSNLFTEPKWMYKLHEKTPIHINSCQ